MLIVPIAALRGAKVAVPDKPKSVDVHWEDLLAFSLMQAIKPDMDQEACCAKIAIRVRADGEDPCGCGEDIPSELLDDCANTADGRKIKSMMTANAERLSRRRRSASALKTYVAVKFGAAPKPSEGTLTAESLRAKLATPKGFDRWWNSVDGVDSLMSGCLPRVEGCDYSIDNANGRFLLYYPGQDRKSVSWTQRGEKAAQLESLRVLWEFHKKAGFDVECPIPLGPETF